MPLLEEQPVVVYTALIAARLPARQARLILIAPVAGAAVHAKKMSCVRLATRQFWQSPISRWRSSCSHWNSLGAAETRFAELASEL